jgi:RNA polymerase sigma factor (sigma-70 family)
MNDPKQHERAEMAHSISDEELMLQVREGVGEMLGVLFDRYQQPLFSFFYRLTGERAQSEDLVQDVFYRLLKYRHTYKSGSAFRTWLYQVARNARRDRFEPQREVGIEEAREPAIFPRDMVAEDQEAALLRKALLKLPAEKREVLLLSRYQELKYEEIGKILGCEANTVKVRVFRALQELKEIVAEMQGHRGLGRGPQAGVRYDM